MSACYWLAGRLQVVVTVDLSFDSMIVSSNFADVERASSGLAGAFSSSLGRLVKVAAIAAGPVRQLLWAQVWHWQPTWAWLGSR